MSTSAPRAAGPNGMRYRLRVYRKGSEVLVAVADPACIGKKYAEGKLQIEVKEGFYGGPDHEVDERQVLMELRSCTIANLVGEASVLLAIQHGFIDPANVLAIGGVLHAQMTAV